MNAVVENVPYIEKLPPGWMTIYNVTALQKIAHGMGRTDFTVLEIGSFLGRSTQQWFSPYRIGQLNKKECLPPSVMCIDMFDYKKIPVIARKELTAQGYNVDWNGDMQRDFSRNMRGYLPYLEIVKARYPEQYRIDPAMRFDIIFIDATPTKEVIREILYTIKLHCIPYRTLICGPHYTSSYAPDIVDEVNAFCSKIRGRFETFQPGNIWGIKVQGD